MSRSIGSVTIRNRNTDLPNPKNIKMGTGKRQRKFTPAQDWELNIKTKGAKNLYCHKIK
jgi:hypothetical protein